MANLFVLCVGVLMPAVTWAGQVPDDDSAYIKRGQQTEARQKAFHARLDRFYEALSVAVRRAAPDLLPEIAPPPPNVHGYQILPAIGSDNPGPAPGTRPKVVRFNWNAADSLITQQGDILGRLEQELGLLPRVPSLSSRRSYLSLADDYKTRVARRRRLDSNITYNWLWQKRIADDRPVFDHLRRIQNLALERDAITAALAEGFDAPLTEAGLTLGPNVALVSESLRVALSDRLREVKDSIAAGARTPTLPDFVKIEHAAPTLWVVRVPLYTDVVDSTFVREFKEAVEGWWLIRKGDKEYRLELEIKPFSPEHLYCGRGRDTDDSAADCAPPAHGEKIDVNAHVARFPMDGAVLTTGATTLKTSGPRAIVL
jgi:hypothetical protein